MSTDNLPELTEEEAEDYVGECYKLKGNGVEVHKKNCKHKNPPQWQWQSNLGNSHQAQMTIEQYTNFRANNPNVLIAREQHFIDGNGAYMVHIIYYDLI